jgi:RNA polymerase-binding protein DksA
MRKAYSHDEQENAMSSLSAAQLRQIAATLDARHQQLLIDVRADLEKSERQKHAELADPMPADPGDQASGNTEVELNLALIDHHLHELEDIEAARQRLLDERYGACLDCGDEIGVERLLAYPTATRCLVCQEQRERTYAGDAGT